MPTPIVIYGDGPRLASGLARIACDLIGLLIGNAAVLDIDLVQVGVDEAGGYHHAAWEFYGFQQSDREFGRAAVAEVCEDLAARHGQTPIVFTITDPARCYEIVRASKNNPFDERVVGKDAPQLPLSEDPDARPVARFWGYFPIDGWNPAQTLGGPAAWALGSYERLLGYNEFGARVLRKGFPKGPAVQYLPHGIDLETFKPEQIPDRNFLQWYNALGVYKLPQIVVGAVATNQPRKDLGTLFAAVAKLREVTPGRKIGLWLHTDILTKAWDVGELARVYGFKPDEVLISTGFLSDTELAGRYGLSSLTIAPGLGEGFGYPIVESLASGTPVVHVNYAGGAELIPNPTWKVTPAAWRTESPYVILRPVLDPEDVAGACQRILGQAGPALGPYCRGSVSHLDWRVISAKWLGWFVTGLDQYKIREREAREAAVGGEA